MGRTGERHDAAEKRESFLRILFFGKIHFTSQTSFASESIVWS